MSMLTLPGLELDDELVPQIKPEIVMVPDSARAGKNHPITSHLAADRSAPAIPAVNMAVLTMLREHMVLVGTEMNRIYQEQAERRGWPLPLHFDSCRKRAGEMQKLGLVLVLNEEAPRGTENEFTLTMRGLEVLEAAQ